MSANTVELRRFMQPILERICRGFTLRAVMARPLAALERQGIFACLVLLALVPCVAGAVCLDPASGLSGYRVPLDKEARDAGAVVVGRVLVERALKEDATDPDGVTAYDVTIGVLARLKGEMPGRIVIRNENTSARYPLAVGEEHVLFLSRSGGRWQVDGCGNSTPIRHAAAGHRTFRLPE